MATPTALPRTLDERIAYLEQRVQQLARGTRAAGDQLQVRISELPVASQANDIDQFEVSQSGVSRRLTFLLLKEAAQPDLRPFLTGLVGGAGLLVVGNAPVPTVSLALVGVPGTYGDAATIPQISVDQFGRVTGVELVPIPLPDLSGYAPLASPGFTGEPTAPTPAPGNNSNRLATTASVLAEINARGYAPLASPAFTGTPTAPTPAISADDNSLATAAFVKMAIAQGASIIVGEVPPVAPVPNMLWWSSVLGQLFIWYDDGDSQQWVAASPSIHAMRIEPGTLVDFAGDHAPVGWYLCDGALTSRAEDPALFAAIGTKFGAGDGETTFALPDLRGRVTAMVDTEDGPLGTTQEWAREIGGTGGTAMHTLSTSEMPAHSHDVNDPGHNHGVQGNFLNINQVGSGAGGYDADIDPTRSLYQYWQVERSGTGISLGNAGGDVAHPNTQPTMAVNKIIKR